LKRAKEGRGGKWQDKMFDLIGKIDLVLFMIVAAILLSSELAKMGTENGHKLQTKLADEVELHIATQMPLLIRTQYKPEELFPRVSSYSNITLPSSLDELTSDQFLLV